MHLQARKPAGLLYKYGQLGKGARMKDGDKLFSRVFCSKN